MKSLQTLDARLHASSGGRFPLSVMWSRLAPLIARSWFGPLLVGLLATIIVSLALDPAGDYPGCIEGPGLTIDEIFNVDVGVRIADRVLAGDVTGTIREGRTLPDHPPLGRLWLGLFHEVVLLIAPPRGEHAPLVVAAARFGSAVAFGILVWLIGFSTARWFGNPAGWGAAVALLLMPRVFGHAHLAALETVLNLTYVLAIVSVAHNWSHDKPPTLRTAAICGLWLGLALLTKIQAIFIPIPIAAWALINWRHKALLPLLVWGLVGLVVFFSGWPWLWLDPVGNLLKYLGHASERSSIQVWYWGQAFADRNVPWHYPWVMFATTVPLGLHTLGIWGVITRRRAAIPPTREGEAPAEPQSLPASIPNQPLQTTNPGELCPVRAGTPHPRPPTHGPRISPQCLLLANVLFPLIMFSLPGIAVYDGERLFLIVYPLWAIFIGKGFLAGWQWLTQRLPQTGAMTVLVVFLGVQSLGLWQFAPCWLSYYNIGGSSKLGLQPTYWGDSVTRELWQQAVKTLPPNSNLDVQPVLHQFQLPAWESQCPLLRAKGIKLRPYDPTAPSKYLLVFYRREYLPDGWQHSDPRGYVQKFPIIRASEKLAALYERTP